jgi:hypothetical protein
MDTLDQIFSNYSDRNIIMKWTDKDFSNLLDDLLDYFGDEDEVTEFLATEADPYLQKFNIELMEPEDYSLELDPENIPHQMAGDGYQTSATMEEIKRMQQLAGIVNEEKEEKSPLSPGFVFKSEGLRNTAMKWLQNPSNYSKLAKESKYSSAPFNFEVKDSTGIKVTAKEGKVDSERLKKILETIRKKMPNALGGEITEYKND